MDWIATVLSVIGTFIIIKMKHWTAFVVYCAADAVWAFYLYYKHEYRAMGLFIFYFLIQLWGIYEWTKKRQSGT